MELILGIKIGKIKYLASQEKQNTDPDSMSTIMDVYLRAENKFINVEIQTNHKKSFLSGAFIINKLPENIAIFICTIESFN